jgi:hypothetical protein
VEIEDFEAQLADVRSSASVAGLPPELQVFDFISASEEQLAAAEAELGARLPAKYREFMTRYGGGQFLFVDLLPAFAEGGREDLVSVNTANVASPAFVAVAPVGTGDWWGFQEQEGRCADQVDFWFHDDDRLEPASADFLEFLVVQGLRRSAQGRS